MSNTPPTPVQNDIWSTRRLLAWMLDYLSQKEIDSPRLTAELLLAHTLGCERLRLYMEADRPATPTELTRLREMVKQVADNQPVQYVLGEAWFYGKPYTVDQRVLIPRPATETLIDKAIGHIKQLDTDTPRIADIGTGSGCIAITLAMELPQATIIATDIQEPALDLAQHNAAKHKVDDRIEFRHGSLFEPLMDETGKLDTFNLIISNPPYIPDDEWNDPNMIGPNVKGHEPEGALRGGTDGLIHIRPLIRNAPQHLNPGGLIAIEIAHSQREDVLDIAREVEALENAQVTNDHEDYWRLFTATSSYT